MDIGPIVRTRRLEQGLTLSDLSDRCGVSSGMLCEIEGGKKNPTIKTVLQIANGLDCTIADLLGVEQSARFEVIRATDRKVLVDPESGIERHLLAPGLVGHGIQVVMYVLPAKASSELYPPERSGVVEHITMLRGRMRIESGAESVELEEGDSATFAADTTHQQTNLTDQPAEFLLVVDSTHVVSPAALRV